MFDPFDFHMCDSSGARGVDISDPTSFSGSSLTLKSDFPLSSGSNKTRSLRAAVIATAGFKSLACRRLTVTEV